jgi:hypothetical protein
MVAFGTRFNTTEALMNMPGLSRCCGLSMIISMRACREEDLRKDRGDAIDAAPKLLTRKGVRRQRNGLSGFPDRRSLFR